MGKIIFPVHIHREGHIAKSVDRYCRVYTHVCCMINYKQNYHKINDIYHL